jgi:protein SCO1/2
VKLMVGLKRLWWVLWLAVSGCLAAPNYPVEGTVIELMADGRVMIEHEEIEGFMAAMTMPFEVGNPDILRGVGVGDRIFARLEVRESSARIIAMRVTAKSSLATSETDAASVTILPVVATQAHPSLKALAADGSEVILGEGQGRSTAITYVYTTCPMPEFCPAIVARLGQLQPLLKNSDARIVAVTIDPDIDTLEVLSDFGTLHGAEPSIWQFARAQKATLTTLTALAGMRIGRGEGQLTHAKRLLVLDADGRLIERYDDANWPVDRVARQLLTGKPAAPVGTSGTLSPQ